MGTTAGRAVLAIAIVALVACSAAIGEGGSRGDDDPPRPSATTWSPPETRHTSPPSTRPPVATVPWPPLVSLGCGPAVTGDWDWYEVVFGYTYRTSAPVVEIGIDYGDGNSYVTADVDDAEYNAFWHRYYSPGAYLVRAWVTDTNGLTSDAYCTFTWRGAGRSLSPGGDLDCVDIGFEHPTPPGDPYGLDGDGDGVACEGW